MAGPPSGRSPSRLRILLVLTFGLGFAIFLTRSGDPDTGAGGPGVRGGPGAKLCPDDAPGCVSGDPAEDGAGVEVFLDPDDACRDAGYLCASVEREGAFRIMRWPEGTEGLRVRVPLPRLEDPARARALQRAAVRGIMAWQGHPFPLTVDDRPTPGGPADVEVRWSGTLGGGQLGITEIDWRRRGEEIRFRVRGLALATTVPSQPERRLEPGQIRLTAAHEMGHALGLPHSDHRRDVMYPRNTATNLTARDYRTMEALYRLPNGAVIRR